MRAPSCSRLSRQDMCGPPGGSGGNWNGRLWAIRCRYHGKSMSKPLPRLRTNLDFMPSPVPDRPGLLMRDSYRCSDVTLIIPPALVECLRCFDGETTELELRQELVRITGDLQVGELQQNLIDTLAESGFL